MKKFLLSILSCIVASIGWSQSVTVDATIDSLQILIGDQANIKLEVSLDAGKPLILPMYPDTLVKGVEVLDIAKPDTQYLNGKKRMLITQNYTITSFDSALYYLPPMEVLVDSVVYKSKPLALKVYSIPVDTLNPEQFYSPKDVMSPEFVWSDWYLFILCLLIIAPALWTLIYLIKRFLDNQPIIRKIKVEPKLPPHQIAMKEMERIKSERIWVKGESKQYYTELTDVIRTYIADRFGFSAMEMTSDEIIEKLTEQKDETALRELRSLFQTADLVKFAKHTPMLNENDANLITAVDFINKTKVEEDPDTKPEPTEITIVEKRPLRTKIILGIGIALLVIVLIGAITNIITELYNYFA